MVCPVNHDQPAAGDLVAEVPTVPGRREDVLRPDDCERGNGDARDVLEAVKRIARLPVLQVGEGRWVGVRSRLSGAEDLWMRAKPRPAAQEHETRHHFRRREGDLDSDGAAIGVAAHDRAVDTKVAQDPQHEGGGVTRARGGWARKSGATGQADDDDLTAGQAAEQRVKGVMVAPTPGDQDQRGPCPGLVSHERGAPASALKLQGDVLADVLHSR